LHYGEYTFSRPPSTFEVWQKVFHGDVVTYKVTVPPGANLYDVALLLKEHSLAEPEAFLAAATSPAELERLGIPGNSAEGYLFPETYTLVKPVTPEEILEEMVRMFRKRFTPEMERKVKASGFSLQQVVTIASIIEKETGIDAEKPLVSAVIRRRLSLGMPLQMDPTVIYGVKRFDGTVTRKDLRTPGPYNTYTTLGLPPGPIANPGMPALVAALTPADVDYLYFVSRNDGSHAFSRTLQEHNRAVESFRRAAREAEG
ncbi:MAG: aminodeoxychorismate lyase, partial [Deltaproteobacteria bacterium]|nr:aminodeoxychorismate lyase [Deltaproteobacteria bacterium]